MALKFTDGEEKILGFRIYYGDGSTVTGQDAAAWKEADTEDVQCVLIFYDRTYQCDGEMFNYIERLVLADYYWYSELKGYGSGQTDIPSDAVVKHGQWSEKFREIYNRSLQDRKWR